MTDLAPVYDRPPAPAQGDAVLGALLSDPERLRSIPIETVERLYAMHQDAQRRVSEGAMAQALAELQSSVASVPHNREAKIATRSGTNFAYTYADAAQIAATLRPHLAKLGLSYAFDQSIEGEVLTVVCTVRHASGAQHTARFAARIGSSGRMSPTQEIEAADTTAKRRALASAFGLATGDEATEPEPEESITDRQAADLDRLITESGADRERVLAHFRIQSTSDLPASQHRRAVEMLEARRRKQEAG